MKQKTTQKIFFIIITLLIFLSIFVVSDIYLEKFYLFEWTKRNHYWGMWLIAIVFIMANKIFISFSVTIGNLIGLILGQYVGDWIRNKTMSQIVPSMDAQTIYELYHHPGVEIWLLTITIFLLTGIVVNCIWRKSKT